jgi:hypothetical protein
MPAGAAALFLTDYNPSVVSAQGPAAWLSVTPRRDAIRRGTPPAHRVAARHADGRRRLRTGGQYGAARIFRHNSVVRPGASRRRAARRATCDANHRTAGTRELSSAASGCAAVIAIAAAHESRRRIKGA